MKNVSIRCSSSGVPKIEGSKCFSGPQLQEPPQSYPKRTSLESGNRIHGFEGIGIGDTLETAASGETMSAHPPAGTHPQETAADNGTAERKTRRIMPLSVIHYLTSNEDGNILLRTCKHPNPSPPYEQLFNNLDRLGLVPRGQSPKEEYKVGRSSRIAPQHRNIEQSLDEILYLPSCG